LGAGDLSDTDTACYFGTQI